MKELNDQELEQVVGGAAYANSGANGSAYINGNHGDATSDTSAATLIQHNYISANSSSLNTAHGGQAYAGSLATANSQHN